MNWFKKRKPTAEQLSRTLGRPLLSEEIARTSDFGDADSWPKDPVLSEVFDEHPGLHAEIIHIMESTMHERDNEIRRDYMGVPVDKLPKYKPSNIVLELIARQYQKSIRYWQVFCGFFYEEPANRKEHVLKKVK